jgi:hypothetical protein
MLFPLAEVELLAPALAALADDRGDSGLGVGAFAGQPSMT